MAPPPQEKKLTSERGYVRVQRLNDNGLNPTQLQDEHSVTKATTESPRFRLQYPEWINHNTSRLSHRLRSLYTSIQWPKKYASSKREQNTFKSSGNTEQKRSSSISSAYQYMEYGCEEVGNPQKDFACVYR
jgi:hypothetical protein